VLCRARLVGIGILAAICSSVIFGQAAVARIEIATVDISNNELAVIVSDTDGVGLLTIFAVRENGDSFKIAEERVGAGTYYLPFLEKIPEGRYVSFHTDWIPQETPAPPGLARPLEPAVRLTGQVPTVAKRRVSTVRVRVDIPPGQFVPAETAGPLTGAWIQVVGDDFRMVASPTFPVPLHVRLPGSTKNVLAYRGSITVAVPVIATAIASLGRRFVGVKFGFQSCDAFRCRELAIERALIPAVVDEPSEPEPSLAFKLNHSSVAIVLDQGLSPVRNTARLASQPVARFAATLVALPDDDSAPRSAIGSHWVIASNGRQFDAIVDDMGFMDECDGSPKVLVARVSDPSFGNERSKYFLASRPEPPGVGQWPAHPAAERLRLDDTQRTRLEQAINRQMRITYPSLLVAGRSIGTRGVLRTESEYNRQVRAGKGRLTYHVEAFKVAPDGATRLFVRAHWIVGRRSQTGIRLWIRSEKGRFVVESSDASVSEASLYGDSELGLDVAARPASGSLLNVIRARNGWSYVIMGFQGYEGFGVALSKYTPDGPQDVGVGYSCGA
jgi:hypothetical protein